MYKVLAIDGGLGRVICAEPAVTEYCLKFPDTRVITSFPDVFTNNSAIAHLYSFNRNGLFNDVIRNGDYLHPEPYHCKKYYTQEHHMIQSFDSIINGSERLVKPSIYLTPQEINSAKLLVDSLRKDGKKVIAYHPFGSAAKVENNEMTDPTFRSLNLTVVNSIIDALKKDYIFINCSHVPANTENLVSLNLSTREYMATISQCDGYISVDSATHHIANVFDIPGVSIFGSTFPANLAYQANQTFIKDGFPKSYPTNRMPNSLDFNQQAMVFNEAEFNQIMTKVIASFNR